MSQTELNEWLPWEAALEYSGHSAAALKRAVSARKVSKKLVPAPGARARIHLLREDLDRVFRAPVHIPAMADPNRTKPDGTMPDALIPVRIIPPSAEVDIAPVLTKMASVLKQAQAWLERQQLMTKLAWTLREARAMTGLTERALREMIAKKPTIAFRSGRRWWFRAEKLRKELR